MCCFTLFSLQVKKNTLLVIPLETTTVCGYYYYFRDAFVALSKLTLHLCDQVCLFALWLL